MTFGAIIVTFNRLDELKKTIGLYEDQTILPEYILVVDNHSTDGTPAFLEKWKTQEKSVKRMVLTLPENTGGSGGFHAGLKKAVELDADWIWVADDDAYPEMDVLQKLDDFLKSGIHPVDDISAVCARVQRSDGIAVGHRCRHKEKIVPVEEYQKPYFELNLFSFVGSVISKRAIRQVGLPRADFFLYSDDYEYALRLGQAGKIFCVPAAVVNHNDNADYSREASWRDYYATRNILIVYKTYYSKLDYVWRKTKRILTAFSSFNPEKVVVFLKAMKDARLENTGLDPIYRPGWKPKRIYRKQK